MPHHVHWDGMEILGIVGTILVLAAIVLPLVYLVHVTNEWVSDNYDFLVFMFWVVVTPFAALIVSTVCYLLWLDFRVDQGAGSVITARYYQCAAWVQLREARRLAKRISICHASASLLPPDEKGVATAEIDKLVEQLDQRYRSAQEYCTRMALVKEKALKLVVNLAPRKYSRLLRCVDRLTTAVERTTARIEQLSGLYRSGQGDAT